MTQNCEKRLKIIIAVKMIQIGQLAIIYKDINKQLRIFGAAISRNN